MICKYFADDGTEFDDYDECNDYEHRQEFAAHITESKFWDEDGQYMTTQEWLKDPEDCDFMEVSDSEEAYHIQQFLQYVGICSPWRNWRVDNPTAGRYYYSREKDDWRNFDTDQCEILRILNIFEG